MYSNLGRATWKDFNLSLEKIFSAAKDWKSKLKGIKKPWLCWNVSSDWCLLQQKLVIETGWTPVIGFDPRAGPPSTVLKESILIDFNEHFGFHMMKPHFPLEFAFLFCERLAFWHSDLLLSIRKMKKYAFLFESLKDGEIAAVKDTGGLTNLFNFKTHRYWELLGCTTKAASKSQFINGCGWWRHFYLHPNFNSKKYNKKYHWEYGCGIKWWKKNIKGNIVDIKVKDIIDGHFTRINAKNYKKSPTINEVRNLPIELNDNFNLRECAKKMAIDHLLD